MISLIKKMDLLTDKSGHGETGLSNALDPKLDLKMKKSLRKMKQNV